MPQFLEDAPGAPPFSTCSMKAFYRLEKEQLTKVLERDQAKFVDAPGLLGEDTEEILETQAAGVPTLGTDVPEVGGPSPLRRRVVAPTGGMSIAPVTPSGAAAGSPPLPTGAYSAGVGAVPRLRGVPRPPTT
mgnify:FL=1